MGRSDEKASKPAGMTLGGHIVRCDERQRWKWKTHYRDSFTPHGYESYDNNPAGGVSSRMDLMQRPIDERKKALREEYYGHQFSFSHTPGASPLEGKREYKLPYAKTSELIGAMTSEADMNRHAELYNYDGETDEDEENDEERRRLSLRTLHNEPYNTVNNNRNAWYRNVSQIGEAVWGLEYDRPGVPKQKDKTMDDPNKYQYTAHPGYAPLANTHHFNPNDPNYCTTKAAVDHDTVGQSMSENLYTLFGQSVQGQGFQVQKKTRDGTIVSADTPAWFQIPGVTVNKLSQAQLQGLVQWKAPIPKNHTDARLLDNFFGEEVFPQPLDLPHDMAPPSVGGGSEHERRRPSTVHTPYRTHKASRRPGGPSEASGKLPPRPPTSHGTSHRHRRREEEHDDRDGGMWTPPLPRPESSHGGSHTSVLSRANLERHNYSRNGTPPTPLSQNSVVEKIRARHGTDRFAHMAPSEAAFSMRSGSNASARSGNIYGQEKKKYGGPRPGTSPEVSSGDLVSALQRAAKGEGAPSMASSYSSSHGNLRNPYPPLPRTAGTSSTRTSTTIRKTANRDYHKQPLSTVRT